MKIVCLAGLDGAGKTTQLTLLNAIFRRRGLTTCYLWLRWSSFLTYPLYFYAKLFKRTVVIKTRVRPIHIHVFWMDPILRRVYPRTLMLDVLIHFLLMKLLARVKGINVMLLDRCFLDVIVDLLWEVKDTKFIESLVCRACFSLLKSMKLVILVVNPLVAAKRKPDIVSIKELKFKRRIYEILAKRLKILVIDTTRYEPSRVAVMLLTTLA